MPTYRLSLDYVLFEDSSDWGPDTLKRAREVRADIAGVQAGKASLQKTLEKEGLSGVEKELKAVAPPPKKQR